MNKRERGKLTASLLAALICIGVYLPSCAAEIDVFAVRAVIPENQIDSRNSYFDLLVAPGHTQVLQVEVFNESDQEMAAVVQVNNASTARNGLIVYSEPGVRDESMSLSVEDMVEVQQERVVIPPGQASTVELTLTVPDIAFDGVILGGIVIGRENTQQEPETETDAGTGVNLVNKVTYVLGLKLTQNPETELEQDFALGEIQTGLVNYRPAVTFSLKNPVATIVKGLDVDAQIYRKGEQEPVNAINLTSAEMAPNSSGDFVLSWGTVPMASGSYSLHLTASHDGRQWSWEEAFQIRGDEVAEINDGAVGLEREQASYALPLALLTIALVVLIAAYLYRRKGQDSR